MTLHLIKLCVGVDTLEELAGWQAARIREQKKRGKKKPELIHVTRMMPKRAEALLDGGSLYWVIKGYVTARQKLLDIRSVTKNGAPHCGLVYAPKLVPVARRFHRPFQGWRYLRPEDAPADLAALKGGRGLPDALKSELAELGLL